MAWEILQQPHVTSPSSPSGKPCVAVCLPHLGEWSAEWSDRVYGPLKFIADPRFDKVIFPARGGPIDVARNLLVKNALADPLVTHVMFWDSDVIPETPPNPNDAIQMLLQCNAPIAAGIYRARQKHGFNWSMWAKRESGFVPIQSWTGNWLKVDVIGMGCCLIQRQVFEKTPQPWFKWGSEKDIATPSEDFNFCVKTAEAGFEVKVFTEIRCSHISGMLKVLSDGTVTVLDV